jgi:undecaprenyl-diphosphatase
VNGLELLDAVILGVVEGVTEFLPISSTGHLIVAGSLLDFTGERAKTFEIVIQFGAILAVMALYRERFRVLFAELRSPVQRRFALNLAAGFLPAAVIGLLIHHWIKAHAFVPLVVSWTMVLGGVAILGIERWRPAVSVDTVDEIRLPTALGIGLAQTLALIPGVSRSGATIMGGYLLGCSRRAATEFSFFLAVPVIAAAAGYDLFKGLPDLTAHDVPLFLVGFAVAFVSAFVVVGRFLRYVSGHSFAAFAWYRIVAGTILLWWLYRGGELL